MGKAALQSTMCASGYAARAVDGNTASSYPSASCTHTCSSGWWRVDFGKTARVHSVRITNRGKFVNDCQLIPYFPHTFLISISAIENHLINQIHLSFTLIHIYTIIILTMFIYKDMKLLNIINRVLRFLFAFVLAISLKI